MHGHAASYATQQLSVRLLHTDLEGLTLNKQSFEYQGFITKMQGTEMRKIQGLYCTWLGIKPKL